jgi:hypothetical protein
MSAYSANRFFSTKIGSEQWIIGGAKSKVITNPLNTHDRIRRCSLSGLAEEALQAGRSPGAPGVGPIRRIRQMGRIRRGGRPIRQML